MPGLFKKPKVPSPPPPPPPPQRADAATDLGDSYAGRTGGVSGVEPSLIVQGLQSRSSASRKKTLG